MNISSNKWYNNPADNNDSASAIKPNLNLWIFNKKLYLIIINPTKFYFIFYLKWHLMLLLEIE